MKIEDKTITMSKDEIKTAVLYGLQKIYTELNLHGNPIGFEFKVNGDLDLTLVLTGEKKF